MDDFDYSGKDNLDVMALAVNYNRSLFRWISCGCRNGTEEVLDFGAGRGEFCNRFQGSSIVAVEPDQALCRHISCASYNGLETITRRFDLIYSINVLEHVEDDRSVVTEFHRLLKEGGRVKIFVPAKKDLFAPMDRKVGHVRRYEREELIDLFAGAGFDVLSCRFFDFLGYFSAKLYNRFGNDGTLDSRSLVLYDRIVFPVSRLFDIVTAGRVVGKNLMLEAVKRERMIPGCGQ